MNKKITFLLPLLFILFFACSSDDDPVNEPVAYEKVPILRTDLPQELIAGKTTTVRITYSRPTRCHKFSDVQLEELKGEFYFAIVTAYDPDEDCEREDLTASTTIDITAEPVDFYIFNFWQGQNAQGEDVYLTVKVPVRTNST